MTTSASIPASAAAHATAWAAFPAEMETTPRRLSSSESDSILFRMPRGLNDPVRWKSSAFRKTRAPVRSDSVAELKTGVRCSRPAVVSRARRTSSREGMSTPGWYEAGAAEPPPPGRPVLRHLVDAVEGVLIDNGVGVRTATAVDDVVAAVRHGERVSSVASGHVVLAVAAGQAIASVAAVEGVVARAAANDVLAPVSKEIVVGRVAGDVVDDRSAGEALDVHADVVVLAGRSVVGNGVEREGLGDRTGGVVRRVQPRAPPHVV